MILSENTILVTITNILGFVTWGFPLLTLTILAYCIEFYTGFKTKWKLFFIATLLALFYPIEHAYEYWENGLPVTEHILIVNLILLSGMIIGGYAALNLLKFQSIKPGKTKSVIEALWIVSLIMPLTSYLFHRVSLPLVFVMISYNISVTILIFIFLTIGKITQKYIPQYHMLAYASARLASILLMVDPVFINYGIIYGIGTNAHYWLRFMGVLTQCFANLLLILIVIMLILEARVRGGKIMPSEEMETDKPKKYRLDRGFGYLITESSNDKSFDVFLDHINHKYYGLIVTRISPSNIRQKYDVRTTPILWMTKAETDEKTIHPNELRRLLRISREFIESQKDCIIILQRFDYLITENGFEKTLKFLHDLNDVIMSSDSVILVSLDDSTLSSEKLALIRQELQEVSFSDSMILNEPLYEILVYVYDENKRRKMPSYKTITKNFSITKTTARKRIHVLEGKGLIKIITQGKFKLLEVTERGRNLLRSPVGPRGE